jgi:signal transduction histidine kinase
LGARRMAEGRETKSDDFVEGNEGSSLPDEVQKMDHSFLFLAYRGVPRIEFLQEVCQKILADSRCDIIELWFREKQRYYRCVLSDTASRGFKYEIVRSTEDDSGNRIPVEGKDSIFGRLRDTVIRGIRDDRLRDYSLGGSLYVDDIDLLHGSPFSAGCDDKRSGSGEYAEVSSVAVVPIKFCDRITGLLLLHYLDKSAMEAHKLRIYENLAKTLGIALMTQQAQSALRERVKELTCLYSIAQVAEREEMSTERILQGIVELLPPAWQYPEITSARIVLDGKVFSAPGFQQDTRKQSSKIIAAGKMRGFVDVVYTEPKPDLDEGPFLSEERSLIDAIARQVALIVERKEAGEERVNLEEQLRHADRLATLGQLAAGVAHEINEPLGSMLGFAQLVKKHPRLPGDARKDMEKIEAASLHAREVVKKLMLFGRQMPPRKTQVNINRMIDEGLYFIKSRCQKSDVEIRLSLSPDLPTITVDQSQIYQALVNLVVNAIQAMPDGGLLTITTRFDQAGISLIVEDTGIGMDEETQKKIFMPFFTTKEIHQGTGIGLSVVHGIIASHGGRIFVDSEPGKGSRFEILLPIKSPGENPEESRDDGENRE